MKRKAKFLSVLTVVMSISLPSFAFANEPAATVSEQQVKINAAVEVVANQDNEPNKEKYSLGVDPIQIEAQLFYDSVAGKAFEELTEDELTKMREINSGIRSYVESLEGNSGVISPLQYQESDLSKGIEGVMNSTSGQLTYGDIAVAFDNANEARDIGTEYARLMGYSVTWDNPADAYRHFAWNYFNTKDLNANKARLIGDNHELALIGAKKAVNYPGSLDDKIGYGLLQAYDVRDKARASSSVFNSNFDNSSVMDLINNSKGRQYALNSYNHVSDAFIAAHLTHKVLIGYPSDVTSSTRTTAWNSFK